MFLSPPWCSHSCVGAFHCPRGNYWSGAEDWKFDFASCSWSHFGVAEVTQSHSACCWSSTFNFQDLRSIWILSHFFQPFYLIPKLVQLLECSLVLAGRQIQRSHSRLHSSRSTSSCKRRQRQQQRQSRRSGRWPGRRDLLQAYINSNREGGAVTALGVLLLL